MPVQEGELQSIWDVARIRQVVHDKLGKRPCWFQIQVAQALYMKQKDVVGISATGSGKTLSFWIPLLMALEEGHDKMTIVVTPLNLLGKQNVASLQQAGISAVAVSADNSSPEIFTVRLKDIFVKGCGLYSRAGYRDREVQGCCRVSRDPDAEPRCI